MIVKKANFDTTDNLNFEKAIFKCFNHKLAGDLCKQCIDREQCDKEYESELKYFTEMKDYINKFQDNNYKEKLSKEKAMQILEYINGRSDAEYHIAAENIVLQFLDSDIAKIYSECNSYFYHC